MTPVARKAGVLLGLVFVHDLDHVRQGRAVGLELFGVGLVAAIAATVVLVLAGKHHRLAAPAAAAVGFGNVAGLIAVHVLPDWGAFSDSYPAAGVDAASWGIVIVMMLAGLALGTTAVAGIRQERVARASP